VRVWMLRFVGRVCVEVVVETDVVSVLVEQVGMDRLELECAVMLVLVTWRQSELMVRAVSRVLEMDDQM
jgi:hypothetical protein